MPAVEALPLLASVDVAVIGAGITGLCAALALVLLAEWIRRRRQQPAADTR